jgi:hypothetical protein
MKIEEILKLADFRTGANLHEKLNILEKFIANSGILVWSGPDTEQSFSKGVYGRDFLTCNFNQSLVQQLIRYHPVRVLCSGKVFESSFIALEQSPEAVRLNLENLRMRSMELDGSLWSALFFN